NFDSNRAISDAVVLNQDIRRLPDIDTCVIGSRNLVRLDQAVRRENREDPVLTVIVVPALCKLEVVDSYEEHAVLTVILYLQTRQLEINDPRSGVGGCYLDSGVSSQSRAIQNGARFALNCKVVLAHQDVLPIPARRNVYGGARTGCVYCRLYTGRDNN